MSARALVVVAAAACVSACGPSAEQTQQAVAAFETVRGVLQHPRCRNCHVPGDAPLQFDAGVPHPMGVGAPGLPCSTCHGTDNPPASYGEHQPPGAPNWQLPPPEHKMVFVGLDAPTLCRLLRDGTQNGGKNLAQLLEHVTNDRLVLWGWNPGVGRAPVATSHAEFVAAFETWVDAGGPCAGA